jgi:Catalytic LigB subunit of aromatic ring-opening dioxygenase
MADILGLGMTHYPGLYRHDADMVVTLRRTLSAKRTPERLKDPANWPAPMREEWGNDDGATAARAHRTRCFAAIRTLRQRLDAFRPDLVVIFGDDQYENFVEDIVPPFCVYIVDQIESRPFDTPSAAALPRPNYWNEPRGTVFKHRGHTDAARFLTNRLAQAGVALPYAYKLRYEHGLAHAFINTLLYLDLDRKGFNYPVLPFHVNCYGGALVRSHGGSIAPGDIPTEPDPPAPSAATCFDVGRAIAKAFAASPWRVALIGSSSWSHAFLTAKNGWLYPDLESDRTRLAELREGRFGGWRELSAAQLEDAGQHELLNWITLAGAMHELGKKAEIVDYAESYLLNSNKCFAVFS